MPSKSKFFSFFPTVLKYRVNFSEVIGANMCRKNVFNVAYRFPKMWPTCFASKAKAEKKKCFATPFEK